MSEREGRRFEWRKKEKGEKKGEKEWRENLEDFQ